jgi:hypothetical protein
MPIGQSRFEGNKEHGVTAAFQENEFSVHQSGCQRDVRNLRMSPVPRRRGRCKRIWAAFSNSARLRSETALSRTPSWLHAPLTSVNGLRHHGNPGNPSTGKRCDFGSGAGKKRDHPTACLTTRLRCDDGKLPAVCAKLAPSHSPSTQTKRGRLRQLHYLLLLEFALIGTEHLGVCVHDELAAIQDAQSVCIIFR